MLRYHRLKKSRFSEEKPSVVATVELNLKTVLQEIDTNRKNLTVVQEEILGQPINKAMAGKPKVRV